jgi:hypothetical protein
MDDFKQKMYTHLLKWKSENAPEETGSYAGKSNDLFFPKRNDFKYTHIYLPIQERLLRHQVDFPFKSHRYVAHIASSQAACFNLFLPIFIKRDAVTTVLSAIKKDFKELAIEHLDSGFRFEFWEEGKGNKGLLGDHTMAAGTDSDVAIAYRDHENRLCLWLIEHKLTENEFTECGGAKSKGRKPKYHNCDSVSDIYNNHNFCYYHSSCHYEYWNLTLKHEDFFKKERLEFADTCPFKYGLNQLWRNQLLGLAIEDAYPELTYEKVFFSVVHHPQNHYLDKSISEYQELTNHSDRFFTFKSNKLIEAAKNVKNDEISNWVSWYEKLYLDIE